MKAHPKIIDRIIDAIAESKSVCIVGHVRPDGDCIGSQLALAMALRNSSCNSGTSSVARSCPALTLSPKSTLILST